MTIERGVVTRIDEHGGVYVEIPRTARGYERGPLEAYTPGLAEGDRVIVATVGTSNDDYVVIAPRSS